MSVNLPEKRYYTIGEVAKAFDVKPSLLRFWENEFETIKPKKNSKGTRKYTPDNLKQIQFVYHLVKEKGMTLAGAKKQMNQMGNPEAKVLLLDKLKKIRAELQSIKDQL
ncbi:MAG: transcriptional regulator [Flavobacteriales bacterium MED-G22]|nr:MAG: transcriptional regulator [Flavobacteriales bacterium MED-G22]|tara:strand:+ start:460 stop:786 length:327 start_codon:yes stop_codon:yes gene_type:complete